MAEHIETMTKPCTGCERELALEQFHRDKSGKHGRRARCRECVAEYARANRARGTERMRAWRAANPERDQENARRYREENRDQLIEQRRKHRAENPHVDWESDYRKRSRAAGYTPVVVSFTREELVDYWGNGDRCIWCDGPFQEIDHLYPVSLGGLHIIEATAPSCSACNRVGGHHVREHIRERDQITADAEALIAEALASVGLAA